MGLHLPRFVRWIQQLGQAELWTYPDDVPCDRLYKHHRIARTIAPIWMLAGALMAATGAEFLLTGGKGWLGTVSLVVMIASCATALIMCIPGVLAGAWAGEVERTLERRGLPLPPGRENLKKHVQRSVLRMMYWFAVMVIGAALVQSMRHR